VREGRIMVDPSRNKLSYTYHDSCNFARSCGMYEEPRELLRLVVGDFREMHPNRAENYCCTGGGGAMSMSEYTPRRLKSAVVKADQLRETGAQAVVTSCHNCMDGLADLIKHYKLNMKVTQLVNLVAGALVPVPKVAAEAKPTVEAMPLAGRRILVVDDEPDTLTYLATVLTDNGAATLTATTGDEALDVIRREKPDLVTLDISMPGKDGGAVFEAIRRDPAIAQTRVCIVTGRPELRRLIYDRPVPPPDGYLTKPVAEKDFVLAVRKILEVAAKS